MNSNNNEEIVVILPVHNGAKTLERALDSVVCQSIFGKEKQVSIRTYCILNGCSDGSAEICKKYENVHGNDKFIILESLTTGLVPALNLGLWEARKTGNKNILIARLDCDDLWYPKKLEKQLEFLSKNPQVDILGTQIRMVEPELFSLSKESVVYPTDHAEMISWMKNAWNPIAHPSVMFRASIFDRVGGYSDILPMCEDFFLWCSAAKCGYVFANLSETLVDYTSTHNPNYNPISPRLAAHYFGQMVNILGIKERPV